MGFNCYSVDLSFRDGRNVSLFMFRYSSGILVNVSVFCLWVYRISMVLTGLVGARWFADSNWGVAMALRVSDVDFELMLIFDRISVGSILSYLLGF